MEDCKKCQKLKDVVNKQDAEIDQCQDEIRNLQRDIAMLRAVLRGIEETAKTGRAE
jgi:peptidoglycan hydrolase CwlO-like protein